MEIKIETEEVKTSQPKQEWSKPELKLLSVTDNTLGLRNSGHDMYASLS